MANLDMGQIMTAIGGLPPAAPVIITAGSLIALIQAAGAVAIPYYPTTQDEGLPPTDTTQFPGF